MKRISRQLKIIPLNVCETIKDFGSLPQIGVTNIFIDKDGLYWFVDFESKNTILMSNVTK
mgnify:CR=1 FL=1